MEAVEIETCIPLSRAAAGDIPFGAMSERYSATQAKVYGGEIVSDCQSLWTAGTADTTPSLQTASFDIYEGATPYKLRLAIVALADHGKIAYASCAATDMSGDSYIYILIKSTGGLGTAGDLVFAIAEDAAIGTPRDIDLPIMVAATWHYFKVAFSGTTGQRDAVISFGLRNETGGALTDTIEVQYVGRGNALYEPLGFACDDQVSIHSVDNVPTEEYESGDSVKILAAGHVNPELAKGCTCVAGQRLYPLPGNGKLHTSAITATNESRMITATEDQTTSGGQVGVKFLC